MFRQQRLTALLMLTALAAPGALAQPAAPDGGTQRLIDQLCPPGAVCRGIRMQGADTGTPNPAAPAPQAAVPTGIRMQGADTGTPNPPPATPQPPLAGVSQPLPRERVTTAPAGVAAVAITVNFSTGSAVLTPQAAAALGNLGRALASAELAPYRFRIEGHTDTVGDERQNLALSQRRAEAVRAYLTNGFGVEPGRLEAVGLGESQPLIPTPDQTPEAGNRRVQVLNLGG